MKALTFKLKLLQPLLIGQLGAGEENSAISFDYVAGSTIRGALIGRYMEENGDFDLATLPVDAQVRRLFFNGDVTYLNAYPQDEEGRRTLPTPRSWKVEKDEIDDEVGVIFDSAIGDIATLDDPKSLTVPFCAPKEDETTFYHPKRHTGLHNASTERYIKQENDSVVFRYDALAADQILCAAILSADTTLLDTLQSLIDPADLFLGRSRSAGYGHAQIIEIGRVDDWHEYAIPTPDDPPEVITLTLLSDAILRDQHGQYTPALQDISAIGTSPVHSFIATDLTGGFNRKWGLPLPQTPVVKAGSVWVFAQSKATEAALQALVATGIGERRLEGFGRVAVNWQQYEQVNKRAAIVERKRAATIALNDGAQRLAQQMVARLYHQQLDQKLLERLAGSFTIQGKVPENTQLSRLRIIVRRAWREKQQTLVTDFLKTMKPLAKNQYLQATVEQKSLFQWLEEGWPEDKLWREYFYISPTDLPKIGDVQAQATADLKLEYSVRLIDALCNKAIKERQAKERQAKEQQKGVAP